LILKQASDNIVKRFEDSFKAAKVLKEIDDAISTSTHGSDDMIQKMADAIADLSKEQAVLALATKHVSKEDQFAILLKAGLVEETEREVFMTNADSVAKTGNLAITEKLKTSYQGLVISTGLTNAQLGILLASLAAIGIGIAVFNHFYDSAEEIKEKADEAASSISNLKSEFDNLEKSTKDIKYRFAELAQEVDNLGTLNQSVGTLNTEEYEEFLDLSNQLSELFPQLTKGYDDNGNAILNLSGNVNTIVGSLNDLVDVQKELANQEILDNMPDLWDGYALDVKKLNNEKENTENHYNDLLTAFGAVRKKSSLTDSVADRELQEAFENAGLNVSDFREMLSDGDGYNYEVWDFSTLTDEQIKSIEFHYGKITQEYLKQTEIAETKIKAENAKMNKHLYTWFSIDSAYADELDIEKNQIMEYLMANFDISSIPTDVKDKGWDAVTDWIEKNILSSISSIDNEEVQRAMLSVLAGDYDSFPELKELYSIIQSYFSPDDPIMLYFEANYGSLNDSYNSVVDKAALKFTGNINSADDYQRLESEKQALDKFAKENSINTQEQISFWNQCLEESETREEAMRRYLEEAPDMFGVEISSVTDSIEQLNTKLKPAMNSIESAWQDIFTENGFNLDEIDLLSIGDSIQSELKGLSELGLDVDYTAYEDFIRVLEDTESTEDDVRNAFDNLAQSVINAGVSGTEDFETLKDALEDLGVVNNDIIAFQSLIQNVDALTASGLDLANATYEDIEAFANERVEAENATQAIEMLTYQKILNGLADMDTSSEVTNMLALAEKAGVTAEVIGHLTELEKIYQEVASGTLDAESINGKLARAEELKSLIESEVSNVDYESEVLFKPKLKTGSGSGSGSGSPFDWSDLLDKEITLLEKQLDAGLIDFDTYLNKRLALIEQYYNEGKIAADEYYAYLEATYENQISIYDKVISAVTKKLNDQIDDLEKQKKVIEESYQLQIDKIQAEIDLLQKEADKKRDLMDLEKARYEAERARTQRTLKLYNGEQFIYTNDPDSVRDAEENLADKELQFNISILQEKIDALEKEMSDATSQIDEQIEHLQEYIEQWQEVADAYEDAQNEMLASQVLGANWESEILTMRQDALENFKNNYIAAQQAMADAAWRAAEEQIKAAKEAAKGANGVYGGGRDIYSDEEKTWIYNGKEYSEKKDAINARNADAEAAYQRELNADKGSMPSSVKKKIAEEAKKRVKERPIVTKYAKGGVIGKDDNFLSSIAKSVGEDTMIAAKEGERMLTPLQNKNFEKLINIADKLVPVLTDMPFANLVNKNLTPAIAGNSPINFSIGEIHLHEVQDVDTFSKAIINQLPGRVIQAIKK